MLSRMGSAETAVVAGAPPRVGDDEVGAAAELVDRIFEHAGVEIPWPSTFRDRDTSEP